MSESALLRAVVLRIRAEGTFENHQVEVELDEEAPATSGDVFVMVVSGGITPGPNHDKRTGGVIDKLYAVNVAIAMRATKKPRDRRRELLTGFRGVTELDVSMEKYMLAVEAQIEFDYATINAANTLITAETSSTEGFIEPLVFAGAPPGRLVDGSLIFDSVGGEPNAAFVRTIRFEGARRIETRT